MRFYRMGLPSLVDISANHPDTSIRHIRDPHCHPHHELICPMTGTYRALCQGREWDIAPGSVIIYPHHTEHEALTGLGSDIAYYVLQWTGPCAAETVQQLADCDGRIRSSLAWMRDCTPVELAVHGRQRQQLLALVVDEIECLLSRPAVARQDPIEQVCDFIRHNLDQPLDIASCCAVADMSSASLHRHFKRRMGQTPIAYINRCRAERARHLLMTTSEHLPAIAQRVGLSSTAHLHKLIKRHTGRTPSQLR